MENRELIPELKRLGIPVASHSSALDEDSVRLVLEKVGPKARSGEAVSGRARCEERAPLVERIPALSLS